MKSTEIRDSFLEFFEERGHTRKASSSLVSDDPTVLLTTAGMQQFIPYFLGDKTAPKKRYTTSQKCFRTPDIDAVGDESHNTYFEMLGNFSIGDYFKKEAIEWAWEYLTEVLGIDKSKLWVTYFAGEANVPEDTEARELWQAVGVPKEKISEFGRKENFWGPPGESGPCGPSSEIHVDLGQLFSKNPSKHKCGPNCECGRFIEIWNLVFMQNYCAEDGVMTDLPLKNIDTGAGLERIAMVLQGKKNVFETDIFLPLIAELTKLTKKSYDENIREFRIISDHIRGATFLLADGVRPGKNGREYILRRVIRRAIRQVEQLGHDETILSGLAEIVIDQFSSVYPELETHRDIIKEELIKEEDNFQKTLHRGLRHFEKTSAGGSLNGADAFYLFETYGFPIELVREMAKENGISFDDRGYEKALQSHKELSRKGAMDKFQRKGGGQGEEVKGAHTATHLLHQALRDVLGEHVTQAGSRLFDDELSFDFTHPSKMTKKEITSVEKLVNEKINKGLLMRMETVPMEQAKKMGAIGLFESKYGDKVHVCSIMEGEKAYSREFCGGPHVDNTAKVGGFKIIKEKSSSAGVRRIKAVVGKKAHK